MEEILFNVSPALSFIYSYSHSLWIASQFAMSAVTVRTLLLCSNQVG